jgi:hypothetical protein
MADFRLRVRFADGVEGKIDMSGLIAGQRAGVFSALADPIRFAAVCLDHGTVTWREALDAWPNDLDLAPDAMHDQIVEHGEWILA